jgi:hypothetical protein
MRKYPDRDEVIARVAKSIYGETILNNSHRGDVVEMMVLAALGEEWSFVGLGWHPWDIQRGSGKNRVRIQVKQSAALQLWGPTVKQVLSLNWSNKPPSYFERDNPDEPIEKEGWFCEIFVFGVHQELDPDKVDQVDSKQWKFLVVPTCDLKKGAKSITLTKALNMWPLCMWHELPKEVDEAIRRMGQIRASRI